VTAQLLGFGRDLFLIAGGAFFGAFFANSAAKRRFSARVVEAIRTEFVDLSGMSRDELVADRRRRQMAFIQKHRQNLAHQYCLPDGTPDGSLGESAPASFSGTPTETL
jgi:hypothetical protein